MKETKFTLTLLNETPLKNVSYRVARYTDFGGCGDDMIIVNSPKLSFKIRLDTNTFNVIEL